ncbi:serine hydrolase domain-containing protein [Myceligenerans xiligouense]|uniref:CubicO group peptidase (Beta-lactamase class C family) n=1 Tax=Myceligenerans xiligouense TaxID=253184 RepID=A0A3N4YGJ3_9MICO|nr:serine hydrolase domain-containing protein [Myceligenerans xiligouense]RPF19933.1 CubicO group peptidase (beta-lactamase class C family) [Myceligenerans xiligouense]
MHTATTDRRRAPRTGPPLAARVAAGLAAAALVVTTAACAGAEPDEPGAGSGTASGVTTAQELTARDVDAWLDRTLPGALEANGIAGASVAVVHDGEVVTTRGFGQADTGADGGAPADATADTLFRPGSVSKIFTATAVMQLVEQGDVDLDADVSEYLDFEIDRNFDAPVTLRHLLSHTPGFEERIAGLIGSGDEPADLRQALVTDPPEQVYAPGTTPAYSNYGNALAGYVVERVSGEPFEDYLDRHVFEPLGMESSTFRQPLPPALRDRVSQGYDDASGPAGPFEIVGTPPAGALTSSANDMARFMLAQLGTAPEQDLLLRDETREQMYSPALTEAELGSFAGAQRMTLGLFQEDRNGHRIVGHGGDTNYFHSHLQLYPDDGAGIYVSVNSGGLDPAATHALRADLMEDFADRYFPAAGDGGTATTADGTGGTTSTADGGTAAQRENAERLAGTYVSARGFHSTFLSALGPLMTYELSARDDGRLAMSPDPGTLRPNVYEQVGDDVWREVDGERRIAVRTEAGQVTGITHDAAFTLLPLDAERRAGLPILAGATVVLLLGLLAWPAGAVWRRIRKRPAPARDGRVWRGLTRVGVASALLAVAGWAVVVLTVMGLAEVPPVAIRGVQVLQVVGALGMVPAIVLLVGEIRRRAGWRRIAGTTAVILALSAVTNFAIMFQFLSPDISY